MFPRFRDSVVVIFLKRIVRLAFVGCLLVLLFFVFYKSPLPEKSSVVQEILENEPVEIELPAGQKGKEINRKIGNYEYILKPRYKYEMKGLIVTDFDPDYLLNFSKEQDPGHIKDICVIWGENINNGSYKRVKYSSREFNCFFKLPQNPENEFSGKLLSNNHLIPADDTIAATIKKTRVGDQVKFKGVLVDYIIRLNGEQRFSRETNTLKDDAGNGAYENVYVTEFEIIKQHWTERNEYIRMAGYATAATGIFALLLFFLI